MWFLHAPPFISDSSNVFLSLTLRKAFPFLEFGWRRGIHSRKEKGDECRGELREMSSAKVLDACKGS